MTAPKDTDASLLADRGDPRLRDAGRRRHAAAARRGAVFRRHAGGRDALGAVRLGRPERCAGGRQGAAHDARPRRDGGFGRVHDVGGACARAVPVSERHPRLRVRREPRSTTPSIGLVLAKLRELRIQPSGPVLPTASSSAAPSWTPPGFCRPARRWRRSSPIPRPTSARGSWTRCSSARNIVDYWAYKWSDLLLVSSRSLGRSNVRIVLRLDSGVGGGQHAVGPLRPRAHDGDRAHRSAWAPPTTS